MSVISVPDLNETCKLLDNFLEEFPDFPLLSTVEVNEGKHLLSSFLPTSYYHAKASSVKRTHLLTL